MRYLIALALVVMPLALQAQAATVSPGMNRAQVVAALGEPVTQRAASGYTYLFYRNDCGKACGMNDLVVLRGDSVVDAIFRSPSRHYTGTSSSPSPLTRNEARSGVVAPKTVTASKPATTVAPAATVAKATPAQAIPLRKEIPVTPSAAAALRVPTPEQLATLRRDLLGAGLTTTQIRARLREQGYVDTALDADIRGAVPAPKLAPTAPSDTHPSVPVGAPPVRPSPETPAPVPSPAPKPTPKPAS